MWNLMGSHGPIFFTYVNAIFMPTFLVSNVILGFTSLANMIKLNKLQNRALRGSKIDGFCILSQSKHQLVMKHHLVMEHHLIMKHHYYLIRMTQNPFIIQEYSKHGILSLFTEIMPCSIIHDAIIHDTKPFIMKRAGYCGPNERTC